ncbi:MAG: T9SS type A sorting domain-containing protein [Candidatus Krumholzibacteriota bacterium]|nr:T9SS type A sorting domain-containing protein [Candidatus Krumholzibacteriota bacterium]
MAQAPGYFSDSLTTSINYGDEIMLDIQLDRDPTVSVAITAFDVRVVSGTVELSARFISTWGLVEVNVYRSRSGTWKKIDTVSHEGPGEFHYVDRTAVAGESYRYMIGVVDPDGEFFSIEREVRVPSIAASLAQNVPNPFNPTTRISFMLAERTPVRLSIYDPIGRLVVTLVDDVRGQGSHSVNWDGRDKAGNRVGSGVYFYRLTAGRFHATRKMLLIK